MGTVVEDGATLSGSVRSGKRLLGVPGVEQADPKNI